MTHLIAAYSVVWVLICFFLATLIVKNRRLKMEMDRLESRLRNLEADLDTRREAS